MRSASRIARSDAGGALFPGRAGQRDARKRGAKPFMRAATRLPSLLFFRTGYRVTTERQIRIYEVIYENALFNWRNDGSRQNNSRPTVKKRFE